MTGPGTITVTATGSLTAPSSLTPTVASKLTAILSRIGSVDVIPLPASRMILLANGVDFQYHLLDGAQYLNGPLAPYTAPTVVSTAVQASSTLTATAFANNDQIRVGVAALTYDSIYFKTTLDTTLGTCQVLRTGTMADDLTRLYKLINGTGVHGTDYYDGYQIANNGFFSQSFWRSSHGVVASSLNTGAGTMVISSVAGGTVGNAYRSTVVTGAGLSFSASPFMSGGTAGSGTAPGPGTFEYGYTRVRKADEAETGMSNVTEMTTDASANVTVSAYQAADSRDGIDLYRIYRTTDAGDSKYPVDDDASSPYTDSMSDDTLTRDGNDPYDPSIVRSYAAGYPTRYRHHTMHLGSVFGSGAYLHAKHNTGTASVTKWDGTNDATAMAVTLSAGFPKTAWIGRTFRATANDTRYGIVGVNESTKVLTLNRPYENATDGTAAYEVTDERDPNAIYYTEPLLPNNWPYENSIEGVTSDDTRGNMGLRSMWGALISWTRTGAFRIQGDQSGGFTIPERNEGCGAYGSHSILKITGSSGDSGSLIWLGPGGIFGWDGGGPPMCISSPPSNGDEVNGIEATTQRINPLAVDGIVANYNPTTKIARWFVPVDGSLFNNFVINYSLQTRCFTFGACDGVTAVDCVVGSNGGYVTIAGQMDGSLWQMDAGYSDGAYGFECVQSVSSYDSTTNTASVSGTPFPTASGGLSGVHVLLVSATGVVQHATIASNTSSALKFMVPPDTAPAVGTQMIVGGIFWRMKSSKFNLGMPEIRKTLSSMIVQFATTTAGQLWVAFSVNNSDPSCFVLMDGTTDYVDLTVAKGVKYCEANRGPGMVLQVDLFALAPGFDMEIGALEATIKTRDEVKR